MHVLNSGKTGTLYPDFWGKLNKEFSSFFPNFCHGIKSAPRLSALLKNQQILAKKLKKKKRLIRRSLHPLFFCWFRVYVIWTKKKSGFGLDISLLLASFLKTLLLLLGGRLFIIISHFFICSLLLTFFRTLNLFFETVKYDFGKKSDIFKKLLFLGSHQIYIFTRFSIYFLLFHPCMVYYILKTVPFITCWRLRIFRKEFKFTVNYFLLYYLNRCKKI